MFWNWKKKVERNYNQEMYDFQDKFDRERTKIFVVIGYGLDVSDILYSSTLKEDCEKFVKKYKFAPFRIDDALYVLQKIEIQEACAKEEFDDFINKYKELQSLFLKNRFVRSFLEVEIYNSQFEYYPHVPREDVHGLEVE